jgi:hypothetical protein
MSPTALTYDLLGHTPHKSLSVKRLRPRFILSEVPLLDFRLSMLKLYPNRPEVRVINVVGMSQRVSQSLHVILSS